jgi:hypothetical protein
MEAMMMAEDGGREREKAAELYGGGQLQKNKRLHFK